MFKTDAIQDCIRRLKKLGTRVEFPKYKEDSFANYCDELDVSPSPLDGGSGINGVPRKETVAYTCNRCQSVRRITPVRFTYTVDGHHGIDQFKELIQQADRKLKTFESLSSAKRTNDWVEYSVLTHETLVHCMWRKDYGLFTRYSLMCSCTDCGGAALLRLDHRAIMAPQCKPLWWTQLSVLDEIRKLPEEMWIGCLWRQPYVKIENDAPVIDAVSKEIGKVRDYTTSER